MLITSIFFFICTISECDTIIIALQVCMLSPLIKFKIRVISILNVSGKHAQLCDYIAMEQNMNGTLPVMKIEKFCHDFVWSYITWQIQFSCASLFFLDLSYNHLCSKFSAFLQKQIKHVLMFTTQSIHWEINIKTIPQYFVMHIYFILIADRNRTLHKPSMDPVLGLLAMKISFCLSFLRGNSKIQRCLFGLFIMQR